MFRLKILLLPVMAFVIILSSCAPGAQDALPPDPTLAPAQQAATLVSDALTQTALPQATSTPVPATPLPPPWSGLKPADNHVPAAGICGEAQGDPVSIVLGIGPDGLPVAGRCVQITPGQRIKLINQSNGPFNILFGEYHIDLPPGGEMVLDKPAGQYLALGVHFLPMGPELWVKEAVAVTAPPPIVEYSNSAVGYRLNLPGDWSINETNSLGKETIFSPPNAEPFIAYLSISLDSRNPDQLVVPPGTVREDTLFNGQPAIKYTYSFGRVEYFVPNNGQLFLIATDKPDDVLVQSILMTIQFTTLSYITYEVTLADNGRTFVMKIGDKLRINLDYSYVWSMASISDPAVIAGAQDGYFAFANGTATLTMTGNPECLNLTPPCGMPSIIFSITVVIQ